MKPTLCINSYAGSLNIAAHNLRSKVVGSYEDCGYAIGAQELNFPKVDYRRTTADWPKRPDLSGVLVIAHPPCAAFSQQNIANNNPALMGAEAKSFEPHKLVLDYALRGNCFGLAIESVQGTIKALPVYQKYAQKYGYNVFTVKLNAITFGLPQWRPRAWFLFSKKKELAVYYRPVCKPISNILMAKGTVDEYVPFYHRTIANLEKCGLSRKRIMSEVFSGEPGTMFAHVKKLYGDDLYDEWMSKDRVVFKNYYPRMLNSEEWSPCVLHDCIWMVPGRLLYVEEYERIMGFPKGWQWPANMFRQFKIYLSKGVCPPIAEWILKVLNQEFDDVNLYLRPLWVHDLQLTKNQVRDLIAKNGKRHAQLV